MTKHLLVLVGAKYVVVFVMVGALLFASTGTALAASLTEAQIEAIVMLLTSFGADQSAINNVNATLRGQVAPALPYTKPYTKRDGRVHGAQYYYYDSTYYTQPFFPASNTPSTVVYAPSMTFTANPSTIMKGQSTTLTWNSLNSNRCGLVESTGVETILMTSGSLTRSPTVTTTYRLWCMYDRNSAADIPSTQSVTVYVY